MTKPLVIYHANCADGFGAAFAAWMKFGDEAEYFPCQYNTEPHRNLAALPRLSDREVYILDFSFPRPIMEAIILCARRTTWLDHHKSGYEMWCPEKLGTEVMQCLPKGYIVLSSEKSGAYLAWQHFHPKTDFSVPLFIRHIDDHDRWQFKIKGTKEFTKSLWSKTPWSFRLWHDMFFWNDPEDSLNIVREEDLDEMYNDGRAMLIAHEQNVQAVLKGGSTPCKIRIPTDTLHGAWTYAEGLAANCPPFMHSDTGHELARLSGTFGLCWCLDKDGVTAKCGIRSNKPYDIEPIAKAFNGGGHATASGFSVPIETLLTWMKP